ncbi:MAG: hypothetical protein Alis3KO_26440 [Aliiglaciecola sp.]
MKKIATLKVLIVFICISALASCQTSSPQSQTGVVDTLLVDVNVIDITTGSILTNQLVAIRDQKILVIDDVENRNFFESKEIINGEGAFVIPALNDLHVHVNNQNVLPLYSRYGVGLIFNLSGGYKHLKMKQQLEEGVLAGPTLLTVGPTLDGEKRTNPLFVAVDSTNIEKTVAEINSAGYDGIKVYQKMTKETLTKVVEASKNNQTYLVGHVSRVAGISGTLESGLKNIAHGEELSFEAFDENTKKYDLATIEPLVDELLTNNANLIANLNFIENIPAQVSHLETYLSQPTMQLVPADIFQSWGKAQGWFANRKDPASFIKQIKNMNQFVSHLVQRAHLRGVKVLLGTDSGFGGAIPGYSAHLELQSLVAAGLSPLQALQVGTLFPGEHLLEHRLIKTPRGQISVGHAADLILLRANPLLDIKNTLSIKGVVQRGKWASQSKLSEIEQSLKRKHAVNRVKAELFEKHFLNGDIQSAQSLVKNHMNQDSPDPLITASNCIFLGYRYYFGGQKTLAGQFYTLCADMMPNEPRLLHYLAKINQAIGKQAEANKYLEASKTLDPWYQ